MLDVGVGRTPLGLKVGGLGGFWGLEGGRAGGRWGVSFEG